MIRYLSLVLALWLGQPVSAVAETIGVLQGRSYRIDLPAVPRGAPILIGLHGGGGNPDQFARNSGLSAPALDQGYAVIYPAGTGRGRSPLLTWNGGYCCGQAAKKGVDDVAFLDAVIADAVQRFGLDGGSVYLTGMSNGSILAERYAALRPGRVKAVAGVSGTMDLATPLTAPVALLHIHGSADTHVPYAGGQGIKALTDTDFTSVTALMAAFRAVDGPMTEVQRVIDPVKDGMRVIEQDWSDEAGSPMLRLLTIEGGGHVWPGGLRARRSGGTLDIVANTEILQFFAEHR